MGRVKSLILKLLHIEDTPERTALAFSIGVFLGFSPFLGFHTLAGLAIAFFFRLSRLAVLLGVWTNTPWWLVPYYTVATWLGIGLIRFPVDLGAIRETFRLGVNEGFAGSRFWEHLASHGGILYSFLIGSSILAGLLALIAYPLSLRWIRFFRSRPR